MWASGDCCLWLVALLDAWSTDLVDLLLFSVLACSSCSRQLPSSFWPPHLAPAGPCASIRLVLAFSKDPVVDYWMDLWFGMNYVLCSDELEMWVLWVKSVVCSLFATAGFALILPWRASLCWWQHRMWKWVCCLLAWLQGSVNLDVLRLVNLSPLWLFIFAAQWI